MARCKNPTIGVSLSKPKPSTSAPKAKNMDITKFDNLEALEKHTQLLNCILCLEQKFVYPEATQSEFSDEITKVVLQHQWDLFCQHLVKVALALVREFYAHLSTSIPFVYVRGESVRMDAATINEQYGLTGVKDEHTYFVKNTNTNVSYSALGPIIWT
ncbi:hypothetical protein V6N11_039401 [Hibiscus sabdariffa]|uniref:Uncharacterized protein n=1 Tax=Hibiscus sabdariffa TaxID=183260 RepID=A0ABR2SMT4_9ROSI